jgi:stage V sporulation protein R
MRSTRKDPRLAEIEDEVKRHAKEANRQLPEMRFFVTKEKEFMSLLEKGVYPSSPPNFWEGQDMVKRKQRVESGSESSVYYEVVQTGNPSYAYLNDGNNDTMQASVMAHVVGHCEFSELNVMGDSDDWRTEWIMYLSNAVDRARFTMGDTAYFKYWTPTQTLIPFINQNSRFNVKNSVEDFKNSLHNDLDLDSDDTEQKEVFNPFSSSLTELFNNAKDETDTVSNAIAKKVSDERLSRKGYNLKLPCEDIFGFLMKYAPASTSERSILKYVYNCYKTQDFIRRTQIMNEGWAMYWEKDIMMKLFKDKVVTDIVDYAKCFSGVCYPRPFFQRNPYQLGFNMWHRIKDRYNKGIYTPEYYNEKDSLKKRFWDKPLPEGAPTDMEFMESIVKTSTDYNFINRFITDEDIRELYLNRVNVERYPYKWDPNDIEGDDEHNLYIKPDVVKEFMLDFFTSFYRPRIYIIDTDFLAGGLLLFHREDGRKLKTDWIQPALSNISAIWKGSVYLISNGSIHSSAFGSTEEELKRTLTFDQIVETMSKGEKVKVL